LVSAGSLTFAFTLLTLRLLRLRDFFFLLPPDFPLLLSLDFLSLDEVSSLSVSLKRFSTSFLA
jgi:hypothetical protein